MSEPARSTKPYPLNQMAQAWPTVRPKALTPAPIILICGRYGPAVTRRSGVQRMSPGAPAGRLRDDDDDLAFGVPFAEVAQRLGHLAQPVPAVDDHRDLCRLAEPNDRRHVLYTWPDG